MIRLFRDHWLKLSILSTLLLLIGTGCVADRNRMDCPSDTEEYSVTFNLQVPSMQSSLRSVMTPEQERAIGNIHVFVFKQTSDSQSDDGLETLAYTPDFVVTSSELGLSTKDLVVRLQKPDNVTTELYRLVFIANRDLQGLITDGTIHDGMTKNELRLALESSYNALWNTTSIPMWGETNLQSFDNRNKYDDFLNPQPAGANSLTRPIHLIRALARVDVGAKLSYKNSSTEADEDVLSGGLDNFKIKSVAVYRYATKYSVMAAQNNHIPGASGQQPRPTLPSDVTMAADDAPLSCELDEGGDFIARNIYIPERSAGSSVTDRPCIIVGAYYGEHNTSEVTYYRLDFIERTEATPKDQIKPLDILRNHRYNFNITKVLGPGSKTPEDALISEPVNIQCDVRVWDESTISAIAYDGQYWLTVSQDKLKALREGGPVASEIQTSWPKGFKIEGLPDFVTASVNTHEGTDKQTVQFTFQPMGAEFAEGETRTGEAIVRAGRITWPLKFEQVNKEDYSIAIYSDEACTHNLQYIQIHQLGKDYNPNNPTKSVKGPKGVALSAEEAHAKVTFYVKAKPIDRQPRYITIRSDRFELSGPTNLGNGVWAYTVTAPGMDPDDEVYFDTREEGVRFSITTETGKTAEADIAFFQQEYNAIPYYDDALNEPLITGDQRFYLLSGNWEGFYVKANSEYSLKLKSVTSTQVNPADGIVTFSDVTSASSSLHGSQHNFRTYDDITTPKYYEGTATFEVSSPKGVFPTREFTVRLFAAKKQPEANTYLIKRSARQRLLIPLSRINTAAAYYKELIDSDFDHFSNLESNLGPRSDFYLRTIDDRSFVSPRIVWTTLGRPEGRGSIKGSGFQNLQVIKTLDNGRPAKYLLVELDKNVPAGEALVGVYDNNASGNPLLWSWMIWVVDEYPSVETYEGIGFMDRLLGARKGVPQGRQGWDSDFDSWEYHGYQYQFGRKDPFPSRAATLASGEVTYYNGDGENISFKQLTRGDRGNELTKAYMYNNTYTMRKAIENPANIVAHQSAWLYEGAFPNNTKDRSVTNLLWSSVLKSNISGDYWLQSRDKKTVFDPSPYGFTIPSHEEMKKTYDSRVSGVKNKQPFASFLYDGAYGYIELEARNGYLIYSRAMRNGSFSAYYLVKENRNNANPVVDQKKYRAATAGSLMPITYAPEADYQNYLPE